MSRIYMFHTISVMSQRGWRSDCINLFTTRHSHTNHNYWHDSPFDSVLCTINHFIKSQVNRYTVISPGYKIPGYFSELSSGKYTAQFKNFTTARMHRHIYGFQWHFGVLFFISWSIILFTMYYFTAINIVLSLHYTEILNSIIIPSIPYRTRQARSLSLRATQ